MDWNAVGAIGEGIGALAVIASLVYVASQIRLANRISIREARAELVDTIQSIYRIALEHPQHADLAVKLQSPNSTYTDQEAFQALSLASLWITFLSKVSGTFESGLLPERVMQIYVENFCEQLRAQPGLRSFLTRGYQMSSINRGDFYAHDCVFAMLDEQEPA